MTDARESLFSDVHAKLRWYAGLAFGIGVYQGVLFVLLGPVQLEIWRDPTQRGRLSAW